MEQHAVESYPCVGYFCSCISERETADLSCLGSVSAGTNAWNGKINDGGSSSGGMNCVLFSIPLSFNITLCAAQTINTPSVNFAIFFSMKLGTQTWLRLRNPTRDSRSWNRTKMSTAIVDNPCIILCEVGFLSQGAR